MTKFRTIDDLEVPGRTVLVRADLNVPLDGGRVGDDFRIVSSLRTIEELRRRGAKVIVCSHLGRPKGPDPKFTMAPVAARLGELGGFKVRCAPDVAGEGARRAVADAAPDEVVVLENTRFAPGETKNDPALSDAFAALADLFVLDAFGSAHRAHSSTVGVAERLPSAAGRLLAEEIVAFDRLLVDPDRPYLVVLGGAKVSDKLGVIRALLPKVDAMLVGGAMCFTLLAAEGYQVGDSKVEADLVDEVRQVLGSEFGSRVVLPSDLVVADRFAADAAHHVAPATDIPRGTMGLDIGPETAARFAGPHRGLRHAVLERPHGRLRVAGVRRRHPRRGRCGGGGRRPTPWPAAATAWPPCARSAWKGRCRTSPPAAGPGWNCWRRAPCPASRSWRGGPMARKSLIAGNWKMNATHLEAIQMVQKLGYRLASGRLRPGGRGGVPAVHRAAVGADGHRDRLPAHPTGRPERATGRPQGAFTGEISAPDAGPPRREVGGGRPFGAAAALRRGRRHRGAQAASRAGQRHDARSWRWGRRSSSVSREITEEVIGTQLQGALARGSTAATVGSLAVAYEPVWAIGTGRTASDEQAAEVIGYLRRRSARVWGEAAAERCGSSTAAR